MVAGTLGIALGFSPILCQAQPEIDPPAAPQPIRAIAFPRPHGPAYEPLEVEPQERADFLTGRIVDEKGAPIVGATVDAFHWFPGSETKTDADGDFALRNQNPDEAYLTPGESIEVTFSAPGYTPRYIVVQPLGKLKQPVVLKSDTFLYGTVRDAAGQPVPQAKVRAVAGPFEGDGVKITNVPYFTTADEKGQFKLFVPGDTYELFVRAGKETSRTPDILLAPGQGLLQNVALKPGLTFRARVVDSVTGEPISGFRLKSEADFEGVSDQNGILQVDAMYPGLFRWNVETQGIMRWWSEQATNEYERKNVEPDGWQRNFDYLEFELAPNMASVTIVAEKGVRVQGRVLDPNGNPVAGATVAPALTGSGNSLTGDTRFSVRTNAKGEYDGFFPAGNTRQWNLVAHDGDFEKWRQWANGSSEPLKTQPGQVINDFDLRLAPPTVVTGHVVDKDGKPVAHARVRVAQVDARDNLYYVPSAETDAEGRFEMRFVAPGKHFVQVEPFWSPPKDAPPASLKFIEVKAGPTDAGTLTQVKVEVMNAAP